MSGRPISLLLVFGAVALVGAIVITVAIAYAVASKKKGGA